MQLVKKLLLALLVLVVVLAVVGLFLPREVHLERSITIDAPQHTVYTLLSGFTRFNDWSPWADMDPDARYSYEGPSHGEGAAMSWQSDDPNVGNGAQKITAVDPPSRVETELDFGDQGTADAFFNLEPAEGGGTQVTWGFDTDLGMNPIARWFGPFLDGMLGPDYERGLGRLKTLAESLPQTDFSDLDAERTEVEAQTIAYVSSSSSQESEAIAQALGEAYGKVQAAITAVGLEAAGPPIAINRAWGEEGYEFDAAIPVTAAPEEGAMPEDSEVQIGSTWSGEVLRVVHTGSYDGLEATYEKIEAYLAAHGYQAAGDPWDVWVSDPGNTPEDELITEIYFPLG